MSKSKHDLNGLVLMFCQTRGPNYPSPVFDRTATELHQVAPHLAVPQLIGDASGAADLSQASIYELSPKAVAHAIAVGEPVGSYTITSSAMQKDPLTSPSPFLLALSFPDTLPRGGQLP